MTILPIMSRLSGVGYIPPSQEQQTARLASIRPAESLPSQDSLQGIEPNDQARLSRAGQFFSNLAGVQTNDPERFQELMSGIVSQLRDAAGQLDGTPQGDFLTRLSDKFQAAAETGDLTQLLPPRPAGVPFSRIQQAYGQAQATGLPSPLEMLTNPGNSSASSLKGLFANLFNEVSLAASTAFPVSA